MKKTLAILVLLLAAALPVLSAPPAQADRSVANAVVEGSGTISPGLGTSTTPTAQTVTFGGTATGIFNGTPGSCTISFTGTGVDTPASASGSGSASCSGTGISISCQVSYQRIGADVTVSGTCTGTVHGTLSGAFQFVPTSVNPTTSYRLAGEVNVVHTALASAVVEGSGTISPGIGTSTTPTAQSVTFGGTATGHFNGTPGSCTISFTGTSVDTPATASGSGTATCSGTGISISCQVFTYQRIGLVVTVSGACTGTVYGSLSGAFQFIPTSVNPTTSYRLAGEVNVIHI